MHCLILHSVHFYRFSFVNRDTLCTKGQKKEAKDQKGKGLHGLGSPEGGIGGKALLTAGGETG